MLMGVILPIHYLVDEDSFSIKVNGSEYLFIDYITVESGPYDVFPY